MVKIKEIKISIHRKYTQDFQSFGYRIGIMMDVDLKDNPRDVYYQGKDFLNERMKEENNAIANLLRKIKKFKLKGSNVNIVELSEIPKSKDSNYQEVKVFDKQTIKVSNVVYVLDIDDAYHRIMFETDMKMDAIKKDVEAVKRMGVSEKAALLEVAAHKDINMVFKEGKDIPSQTIGEMKTDDGFEGYNT